MFLISPLLKFIMSTIYEWSTSNPSTQLLTFVEFEFNKTSLVYSGLILVSFRSAWACIRSVYSTYIDVYCFRMVKNTKLFAIVASFRFFVRNRGFSHTHWPNLEWCIYHTGIQKMFGVFLLFIISRLFNMAIWYGFFRLCFFPVVFSRGFFCWIPGSPEGGQGTLKESSSFLEFHLRGLAV